MSWKSNNVNTSPMIITLQSGYFKVSDNPAGPWHNSSESKKTLESAKLFTQTKSID